MSRKMGTGTQPKAAICSQLNQPAEYGTQQDDYGRLDACTPAACGTKCDRADEHEMSRGILIRRTS